MENDIKKLKEEIKNLKEMNELSEQKQILKKAKFRLRFKKGYNLVSVFAGGTRELSHLGKRYTNWIVKNQSNVHTTKRRIYKMDDNGYIDLEGKEVQETQEDDSNIFEGYSLGVMRLNLTNF